jgi:hypothetical protein
MRALHSNRGEGTFMTHRHKHHHLTELALRSHTVPVCSLCGQDGSSWVRDADLGFSLNLEKDHFRKKGGPAHVWYQLHKLLPHRFAMTSFSVTLRAIGERQCVMADWQI